MEDLNNYDFLKYDATFTGILCVPALYCITLFFTAETATKQVLGVNSSEEEQTLKTLRAREQEHQRRLEIMEKEHEIKLEILRIEKETAEINRDIARKQLLRLSQK